MPTELLDTRTLPLFVLLGLVGVIGLLLLRAQMLAKRQASRTANASAKVPQETPATKRESGTKNPSPTAPREATSAANRSKESEFGGEAGASEVVKELHVRATALERLTRAADERIARLESLLARTGQLADPAAAGRRGGATAAGSDRAPKAAQAKGNSLRLLRAGDDETDPSNGSPRTAETAAEFTDAAGGVADLSLSERRALAANDAPSTSAIESARRAAAALRESETIGEGVELRISERAAAELDSRDGRAAAPATGRAPRPYADIYRLADEGLSAVEIARRLGGHAGEVELILGLRKSS